MKPKTLKLICIFFHIFNNFFYLVDNRKKESKIIKHPLQKNNYTQISIIIQWTYIGNTEKIQECVITCVSRLQECEKEKERERERETEREREKSNEYVCLA